MKTENAIAAKTKTFAIRIIRLYKHLYQKEIIELLSMHSEL